MSKRLYESNKQPILQQIFAYVVSTNKNPKLKTLPRSRSLHLQKKIDVNFNKNQKNVPRTILNNLIYINLVDKYIKSVIAIDETPILSLVDRIQNLYLKHRKVADVNTPINDFQLFDLIAEELIPPNKKDDTEYFSLAKSVVLYLFELCDIGLPPTNVELPKPLTEPTFFDKE